ncbi:DUF2062 domain-containing protein [uncultured Algibacter sp.]|uniref:DUF2062 domain-containing protein n=1 Tax=uncultured Algibacter sp. TaxID=298659 RepID=UPI00321793E4
MPNLKNLWKKFTDLFKQGLSPKSLALSLVISILVSIFPLFGISTIVLVCITVPFKLNLPIMIAVSYIAEPVKLLFLIPFIKLGATIFNTEHTLLTLEAIKTSFDISFLNTLKALSFELLCGFVGWLIAAVPLAVVAYFILKLILTYLYKLKNKPL